MTTDFPGLYKELEATFAQLAKQLPGPVGGFARLHKEAIAAGQLGAKFKELIALGIAVALRCEDCVAYHVHDALKVGATRAEIVETLGVAMMMGGGPAAMYACEAFQALEQFEKQSVGS